MKNLYLIHHGIKGQKWGVRRYQNEDGSLTAKGKERYGYDPKRAEKEFKKVKKAETISALDAWSSTPLVNDGKERALAKTKTAKQIYAEHGKELRDLRNKRDEAMKKWREVYDDEIEKRDDGKKHEDFYWEQVYREAESTANRYVADELGRAKEAYIKRCEELARDAFGKLADEPLNKANVFGSYATISKKMSGAMDVLENQRISRIMARAPFSSKSMKEIEDEIKNGN